MYGKNIQKLSVHVEQQVVSGCEDCTRTHQDVWHRIHDGTEEDDWVYASVPLPHVNRR